MRGIGGLRGASKESLQLLRVPVGADHVCDSDAATVRARCSQ